MSVFGSGLLTGLKVTWRAMTRRSVTAHYPDALPGAAATVSRGHRAHGGELHGLHAVRPRVPGLVHLHRLAQGGRSRADARRS